MLLNLCDHIGSVLQMCLWRIVIEFNDSVWELPSLQSQDQDLVTEITADIEEVC